MALTLGQADLWFNIPSIPGYPSCGPLTSGKPSSRIYFRDSVPVPSRELAFQKVGIKQRTVLCPRETCLLGICGRRGGTDLGSTRPRLASCWAC